MISKIQKIPFQKENVTFSTVNDPLFDKTYIGICQNAKLQYITIESRTEWNNGIAFKR